MWSPTHVQVTVHKARGLLSKGKNGTNDAFVTIGLGKETFQTSIKEKATGVTEWHEKCELLIPKQGNKAEIVLTALHHNLLGMDEFLGRVNIPLAEMDVYERPKNRWLKLMDKPGKDKKKDRGELEVKISFIVKSGSLSNLSKKEKHKSSLGQLSQAAHSFGGSLISISSIDKRKGLKKLASKISGKFSKSSHKDEDISSNITTPTSQQVLGEADPGVISEAESDDDFALDELSQRGSESSLNFNTLPRMNSDVTKITSESSHFPPAKPPRTASFTQEKKPDFDSNYSAKPSKVESSTDLREMNYSKPMERIIIGKEVTRPSSPSSTLPPEILNQYSEKTREDLIQLILDLQNRLAKEQKKQRDLEDYLDELLLRVMETSPRILQNPYINCEI